MIKWIQHMFDGSKQPARSMVAMQSLGQPVWTPRQYDSLATEGYQNNVIAFRCVNLIARNVSMPPCLLYDYEHEIDQHPLVDLITRPNPIQNRGSFLESLVSYLLLSGNAYVEAVGREGQVKELHLLRPDRMQIIPGENGVPKAYVYQINNKKRVIPVDEETGQSPLLHLKLFHPLNDWYGMSPLEAAAAAIDQHNAVGSHNLALLQNGGRPSGALMVKASEGRPGGSLTPSQRATLKDEMHSLYAGAQNAGKLMILEGDLEWKEMGLGPKDLDFVSGKNLSAREIAQAYGVPSMLVGVPGEATFANYKEARFHLWEDTVLPLLHMVMGEMNRWLVPHFSETLWFTYDADAIPALSMRRETLWNRIQQATFLTTNEKRHALGYSPLEGGDLFPIP
ncbi:MAG: phage portal protein [Alphaproteobacteria bacterium]